MYVYVGVCFGVLVLLLHKKINHMALCCVALCFAVLYCIVLHGIILSTLVFVVTFVVWRSLSTCTPPATSGGCLYFLRRHDHREHSPSTRFVWFFVST